jgi:hypothetical protein
VQIEGQQTEFIIPDDVARVAQRKVEARHLFKREPGTMANVAQRLLESIDQATLVLNVWTKEFRVVRVRAGSPVESLDRDCFRRRAGLGLAAASFSMPRTIATAGSAPWRGMPGSAGLLQPYVAPIQGRKSIHARQPDVLTKRRLVMSIKAMSIVRSATLLGVAVAALAMAPVAMAIDQGFAPRPDFPGPKQQAPQATSPRPDFPGAKQSTAKHHSSKNARSQNY